MESLWPSGSQSPDLQNGPLLYVVTFSLKKKKLSNTEQLSLFSRMLPAFLGEYTEVFQARFYQKKAWNMKRLGEPSNSH